MAYRGYKRKDSNHNLIKSQLLEKGISVVDLFNVGDGCLDMLIASDGLSILVEVKSPNGRLSKRQKEFISSWQGEVIVAKSIDDILDYLRIIHGRNY